MGKYILRVRDPKTGKFVGEEHVAPNTFVSDGKAFLLDIIFGISNWFEPGATDTQWSEMTTWYMAAGVSTNTNAGVVGPTEAVPVPTGGAWAAVDPDDFKLSDELGRAPCTFRRGAGALVATATATFGTAELGSEGEQRITEVGLFKSNTEPGNKARWVQSQRPHTMFSRAVLYKEVSGAWYADPMVRPSGMEITVQYDFETVEA